jgi:hypothetical protein
MHSKPKHIVGKVMRASDLRPPEKISQSDFTEICSTFRISRAQQQNLRIQLDTLVSELSEWMRQQALEPDRRRDRERVENVRHRLEEIETDIQHLGPAGRFAHILITPHIARMLSWTWLAKKLGSQITPIGDANSVESKHDIRDFLIERRPKEVVCAVLEQLKAGYDAVLADFRKGGRHPLSHRRSVIINLAVFWRDMGRPISTGPKSDFITFAELVVEAIGWPTVGVAAEVPKAMKYMRNRYQNWLR